MKKENRDPRKVAIGQRIKELRGEILQEDMIKVLGCTQAYLSQIEGGDREVTVVILLKLFNNYRWNPNYILLGIKPMKFTKNKEYEEQQPNVQVVVREPDETQAPYGKPLEKYTLDELSEMARPLNEEIRRRTGL